MSLLVDIARFVTAAIFVVAGGAKLADRSGTRRALGDFGVPERLTVPGALALPLLELSASVLLILEPTAWIGGVMALALMAIFTAAIGAQLGRGRHPECHCFGRLTPEPVSALTMWRNVLLAVPPLVVVLWG